MTEYYKSLVTDDEVIAALIKESKTRMGILNPETPRVRPNLNFFQRTVNHMVSSNKRINRRQEEFKQENSRPTKKEHYKHEPPPTGPSKNKLWFDKIKFIKSYINKNPKTAKPSSKRKRHNSSSSSGSSTNDYSSSDSDRESKTVKRKTKLRQMTSVISISSDCSDSSVEFVSMEKNSA